MDLRCYRKVGHLLAGTEKANDMEELCLGKKVTLNPLSKSDLYEYLQLFCVQTCSSFPISFNHYLGVHFQTIGG